jgi:hypothetical protein
MLVGACAGKAGGGCAPKELRLTSNPYAQPPCLYVTITTQDAVMVASEPFNACMS